MQNVRRNGGWRQAALKKPSTPSSIEKASLLVCKNPLPAGLGSLSALDQVLLGIRSTLVARSLAPKRVPGCGSFVVPQVRSIARAVTWQESLQATSHLERKYTFEFALLLGTLCFYAG